MQNTYQREYLLRTSDFDSRRQLQPSSVLDLFQCVAGGHAETLGIGFEAMLKRHLLWVVTREKYEVLAQPAMHSPVDVITWPLKPGSLGFQREYLIKDKAGNTLVKGTSEWMVIHSEERKLMPVKDVYPEFSDGFRTEKVFEGRLRRIREFAPEGEPYYVTPGVSCLDMNGHVNNAKYANFVMDAVKLGESESITSLQMDFHQEVVAGQRLRIDTLRDGTTVFARGVDDNEEVKFYCRLELAAEE